MKKIAGYALTGIFLSIVFLTLLLYGSYDARDWVSLHLLASNVENAQALSPLSIPPKEAGQEYLQFIAVGDAGTGGHGQRIVADAMAQKALRDTLAFVLFLGDNIYESGVTSISDPQWQTKFESIYTASSLQVPFYAVLGNHDYRLNPQAEVEYTARSTRWRMPDRYYTFTHKVDDSTTVQFFCLDTQPMATLSPGDLKAATDSAQYPPQVRWLRRELAGSAARWKIVMGHHPLYSNGLHGGNKELAMLLEPLLERYTVDFYLGGHDHDLQLLKPVRGVHHIVSGAGGKHRDVEWRDNTLYAATNLGFVFFRVSHEHVLAEFINRHAVTEYAHVFEKITPHREVPAPASK